MTDDAELPEYYATEPVTTSNGLWIRLHYTVGDSYTERRATLADLRAVLAAVPYEQRKSVALSLLNCRYCAFDYQDDHDHSVCSALTAEDGTPWKQRAEAAERELAELRATYPETQTAIENNSLKLEILELRQRAEAAKAAHGLNCGVREDVHARTIRERDEARAEVERWRRLNKSNHELAGETLAESMSRAARIAELEAEVERLRRELDAEQSSTMPVEAYNKLEQRNARLEKIAKHAGVLLYRLRNGQEVVADLMIGLQKQLDALDSETTVDAARPPRDCGGGDKGIG